MTQLDYSPVFGSFDSATTEGLAISAEVSDLLFSDAHTANRFADEPVTDTQMQAVYDLVKWGPTAMNSQPLRVVLVRTAEARQRLVGHLAEGNKAKTERAPLTAILAADLDFHDELPRVFPAVPTAREIFLDEEKRRGSALMSASLQIGYFIVGVRAAGLAAGPIGGFDAAGIDADFFPDGRHSTLLVLNIGRPVEDSYRPRQPRLDYNDVVASV